MAAITIPFPVKPQQPRRRPPSELGTLANLVEFPAPPTVPSFDSEAYDALTLEMEKSEAVAQHFASRLDDLRKTANAMLRTRTQTTRGGAR